MFNGSLLSVVHRLPREYFSWLLSVYGILKLLRACIASLGIGYIADKIGRKWAYALGLVFSYIGITIEFVATTNPMFFAGKFVKYVLFLARSGPPLIKSSHSGFAIGTFVTLSFTYIGEVRCLTEL
jgi:MFS family permease